MTKPLDDFIQTTGDWRASIKRNNRRTYFVISMFFAIYLLLGLLVDTYLQLSYYPHATMQDVFIGLITFQLFPLATLIMLGIAGISILVTLSFHDSLMLLGTEYREITPESAQSPLETQIYNVVEEMKIAAGLQFMPRVYLIEADYMNAFASGYSEKSAMIAITRGLATKLTRSELQAVLAHELSHIRHLDIKLTLMASVLANLMLIIIDVLFYSAMFSNRRDDNRDRNSLAFFIILLRYTLPIINVLLLLYLSRTREYMADAGCVQLLRDNEPLASALLKIENDHNENQDVYREEYLQTPHENVRREAYIFDPIQAGIEPVSSVADWFSTHPNIHDRLAAIGFKSRK